ncbi:unnamed protein product [Vitrella brassicaformis CCMP3155]|uniref:RING-type domain-containing protein n=1 Tax=Vitrella brassicaformis (strain CCMP3155) TaxID=1169540 RepID=A0A0G4GV99_VITBC|nr:unnamed protein product [Vitrella brassicaformis CCMP3155]|eukprot:CEM34792.1 unnamed protein product [Vitrella brassicaformis CCMP3155]
MLSAVLFALALTATPSGSFPAADFDEADDGFIDEEEDGADEPARVLEVTMSSEGALSMLRAIRENIADSTQPEEEAPQYGGDLTRLLQTPNLTANVEREAVDLPVHIVRVGDRVDEAVLATFVQLLDRHDDSVFRAATSMLAGIPIAASEGSVGEIHRVVAAVLFEQQAVSKLSRLLLSPYGPASSDAMYVALLALHQIAREIPETIAISMRQIMDRDVVPNLRTVYQSQSGTNNVSTSGDMSTTMATLLLSCSLALSFGRKLDNEMAVRYAVEHGCFDAACDVVEHKTVRKTAAYSTLVMSLEAEALLELKLLSGGASEAFRRRVAKIIMGRSSCKRAIEKRASGSGDGARKAKAIASWVRMYEVTGLYRLPRRDDLVSSPWALSAAVALFAVLLGLSALWRFVVRPGQQRRQQRLAEDAAARLIAEEEAKRSRGQGRGRRGHARQPNAASAARRPTAQPFFAAAAHDSGIASATTTSTSSHSGCLTPTAAASSGGFQPASVSGGGSADQQQQEHQVEAMADSGGQWTQTAARHRKKKGRRAGSGSAADGSASQQLAGQASTSVSASPSGETAPPQPLPSTAGSISGGTRGYAVTGGMAHRPQRRPFRPGAPPLVTPPLKQHSSSSTESRGAAPAAADGCFRVGGHEGADFAGELSSGTTAVTLSSPPSSPSDDPEWVRGMEAAWSEWDTGRGDGHHSHDPPEQQRRAEAAAADDAHSVDPARAMALEQKQQAVDRLQELRCELDGKLAAIASFEQRKAKLIRDKETAMRNAPKSVDELDEVVRAGGVEGIRQFSAEVEAEKAALQPIYDAALAKIQQLSSGSTAVEVPHREREQDTATEGAAAASGSSSADAGGLCGPLEGGSSSGARVDDDIGGLGLDEQLAMLTQRISEVEQQLGSGELDRRLRCLSHEVGKLQSRVDAIKMDTHNKHSMACLSSIHTVAEATAFLARVMGRIQQLDGLVIRAHQEENRQLQRRIDDREDDESCAVCHDGRRTVVLIGKAPSGCRHRCLCVTCWHKSYAPGRGSTQCPICRSDIDYRQSGPTI